MLVEGAEFKNTILRSTIFIGVIWCLTLIKANNNNNAFFW